MRRELIFTDCRVPKANLLGEPGSGWKIAMGILAAVLIPLAFSFSLEQKLLQAYYHRAIALTLIDSEMELLAAGEWKGLEEGSREYSISARTAENLPPGRFVLTVDLPKLRLEWVPDRKQRGGVVSREIELVLEERGEEASHL